MQSTPVEQFATAQSERDLAMALLSSLPCDGFELKIDPAQGIPAVRGLDEKQALLKQPAFPDGPESV